MPGVGDDALEAIDSAAALADRNIIGASVSIFRLDPQRIAIHRTRIGVVAQVMRSIMAQWPERRFEARVGKVVELNTYGLGFVEKVLTWANTQVLATMQEMGDQIQRLGFGPSVSAIAAWRSKVLSFATSRFRPVINALHEARAQGKIAIRLPEFREDIGRYLALILEGQLITAQADVDTNAWFEVAQALQPIVRAIDFITDAVADLIAKPFLFLGDLLVKIGIGAGLAYGAYWYLTKD
jgi:hypothetical protein